MCGVLTGTCGFTLPSSWPPLGPSQHWGSGFLTLSNAEFGSCEPQDVHRVTLLPLWHVEGSMGTQSLKFQNYLQVCEVCEVGAVV